MYLRMFIGLGADLTISSRFQEVINPSSALVHRVSNMSRPGKPTLPV